MGGFQTSLPSTPENYSENAVGHPQASNTLQNPILISSSPIRVPSPAKVSSCVTSLISTEHWLPTFIMPPPVPDGPSLSNIQIPSPPPPPQLLPLKPLGPKHPEMIYMWYIAEKEAWLAQNPQVSSDIDEYWKARGWPIYHKKVLDEWQKHLGWEWQEPSGKLIFRCPNWTAEEIAAFLDFEDELQEQLVEQFEEMNDAGRKLPSWKEHNAATNEDRRELAERYTL